MGNTLVADAIRVRVSEMRKTAAAEQAYVAGFCKAAEVIGVDPAALYKAAAGKGWIGELGGRMLGRLTQAGSAALHPVQTARAGWNAAKGGLDAARTGVKRYASLLQGGDVEKLRAAELRAGNVAASRNAGVGLRGRARAAAQRFGERAMAEQEAVARARDLTDVAAGTAGVLGTGGAIYSLMKMKDRGQAQQTMPQAQLDQGEYYG